MIVFVEHYAHKDMIYGFDNRVDYWEICEKEGMHGGCSGSFKFWSNFIDNSSVAILYLSFSSGNEEPPPEESSNFETFHRNQFTVISKVEQVGMDMPHWNFVRILNSSNDTLEFPMHLWTARLHGALPHWSTRNGVMLDVCSKKIINDAHFQCGAEPNFPNTIIRIKTPTNFDCSDAFNLNVIQRFFMFLFDNRL
jgi:hypothetical protein